MDRQDAFRPGLTLFGFRRSLVTSAVVHGTLVATALALGLGPLAREARKTYDTSVAVAPAPPPPAPPAEREPEREPEQREPPEPESVPLEAPEPLPELPDPEPELAEVRAMPDLWASLSLEPLRRIERAPEPVEVALDEAPAEPPPPVVTAAVAPVTTEPVIVDSPSPVYPRASLRLGQEGAVLLRLNVSAAGRLLDAELVESSGFERLDQAALETVQKWSFRPATTDGLAVAGSLLHRVVFRIDDAAGM